MFNLKGLYIDSPWVDPEAPVANFISLMNRFDVFDEDEQREDYWAGQAEQCLKKIQGPKDEFTKEDGLVCDELYNGEGPYKNSWGYIDRTGYNLKPDIMAYLTWNFENEYLNNWIHDA